MNDGRLRGRGAALGLLGMVALCMSSGCFAARALGRSSVQLLKSPAPVQRAATPIVADARLAVTWIGHASMLVQIDDKVILTDPVFSTTVGQISKRVVQPGVLPEQLSKVDAVLISHMHFDHLSLGSLDAIEDKVERLFVPPGGVVYIPDYRFDVRELESWEDFEDHDGLRITAVPVRHVGFRYGVDAAWMTRSFTGYVVEYHGISVYCAGDTAYDGDAFRATHEHFPRLDLALLPIGPAQPREYMRHTHVDGKEAVQAFIDLGARHMLAMHYDTFINSTDAPGDATRLLAEAVAARNVDPARVHMIPIGKPTTFIAKEPEPVEEPSAPASDDEGDDDTGLSSDDDLGD